MAGSSVAAAIPIPTRGVILCGVPSADAEKPALEEVHAAPPRQRARGGIVALGAGVGEEAVVGAFVQMQLGRRALRRQHRLELLYLRHRHVAVGGSAVDLDRAGEPRDLL